MAFLLKKFDSLLTKELFEIYKLRNEIFIVEQNCPYQDIDNKDLSALHLMKFEDQKLIAYCRILPPGASYNEPSIGRVSVNEQHRKQGLGKTLMQKSISETKQLYKNQAIVISAQMYLLKFYADLGFVAEGSQYLEDDIPHIKMRLL